MSAASPPPTHHHESGFHAVLHDKSGVPFSVREFRQEDRAEITQFYVNFEPKRAAQGLPPAGEDRVVRWLSTILPAGTHVVACRNDALIGHAMLMPTNEAGAAEYAVFLRQDVRGRGIGTQLNRASLEVARRHGLQRLWLSVEPHNRAAIRSYQKVGFRFLPAKIFAPEIEMDVDL